MTLFLIQHFVKNSEDTNNTAVRSAYGSLAGNVAIFCNVLLSVSKILLGTFTGSVAITADGMNNLSDASSGLITLLGFKMSSRPADREHPYGHARIEYLAGLAVCVMILFIGVELAKTSFDKILHPSEVMFSIVSVVVLLCSMALKFWMMRFNTVLAKRIDSGTLKAAAMDSRNDVITTGAVLISTLIGVLFSVNLDGWMGLGVAGFILYSGIGMAKSTVDPLLGSAPSVELTQHIAQKILRYEGVLNTHDLMVHDYGPGRRFGSAHVEMDAAEDVMKSHNIIDNIERDLRDNDGIDFVLHYDPVLVGDEAIGTTRKWVADLVASISSDLSIHDFRMVQGPQHTNLIFDVVAPAGFVLSEQELKQRIQSLVSRADTQYYTVITVDTSYAPIHD